MTADGAGSPQVWWEGDTVEAGRYRTVGDRTDGLIISSAPLLPYSVNAQPDPKEIGAPTGAYGLPSGETPVRSDTT